MSITKISWWITDSKLPTYILIESYICFKNRDRICCENICENRLDCKKLCARFIQKPLWTSMKPKNLKKDNHDDSIHDTTKFSWIIWFTSNIGFAGPKSRGEEPPRGGKIPEHIALRFQVKYGEILHICLTHCGLVMPYGCIKLSQHCYR